MRYCWWTYGTLRGRRMGCFFPLGSQNFLSKITRGGEWIFLRKIQPFISAVAHSAQTYEALPVSMIRRAGLIQKLRILRSFSCNVKCDSVVCAADVGRQHSCLLRSFSCNAIFQFFNVTGSVHLTGSITILLRRSAYPYVNQLCSIFVIIVVAIKYNMM